MLSHISSCFVSHNNPLGWAWAFLFYFILFYFILFIYFWLLWVPVAARGPPPVAASEGHSSPWRAGLSPQCPPPPAVEHRLQARGLQQLWHVGSELWLTGSRAQAQQLWRTGLAAPRHAGSSWPRARTLAPCIGRRTPNHCTTREVPGLGILNTLQVIPSCSEGAGLLLWAVGLVGRKMSVITGVQIELGKKVLKKFQH